MYIGYAALGKNEDEEIRLIEFPLMNDNAVVKSLYEPDILTIKLNSNCTPQK